MAETDPQPPSVSSLEWLARTHGYEISFVVGYQGKCRLGVKSTNPYHTGPRTFYADSGEDTGPTAYRTSLEVGVTRMLDYEYRSTPESRPSLDAGDKR